MEKKGNNDSSAIFEMIFTSDTIQRLTTAENLNEFAENFRQSKFIVSVHSETTDKNEHAHVIFFTSYSHKKKKEILDALLQLNCFVLQKRKELEDYIASHVVKLEKECYANTARQIFFRENATNIVPKNAIASRSSFFHLAFRLDEQARELSGKTKNSPSEESKNGENLNNESCFLHFGEKDKERIFQMASVLKSTPVECERKAIFKKIKESCKTRFENFLLLKKLMELTRVQNISEFQLSISEEERIAILCGIQGWETLLDEIFTNIHLKDLRQSSELSYPEKLFYFFGEFHEISRHTDALKYQIDWLESFFLTNKIRIKSFLKYLILGMDTSHLVAENKDEENAYAKRIKIKKAVKIKTTYIFGKTSTGKSLLADLILSPMKSTSLLISNRSFSLSPLKRPVNAIMIQELSPNNLECHAMKKLFGGEEIEVSVLVVSNNSRKGRVCPSVRPWVRP